MGEPSTEWLHSRSTPSSMLLHRNGLTTSYLKAPSSTGQTTTTVRTSTCPAEEPHRIKHREPLTVGTPRSMITPLEKNQAWVDQSLAISPRWCGREALMLSWCSSGGKQGGGCGQLFAPRKLWWTVCWQRSCTPVERCSVQHCSGLLMENWREPK